MKPFFSVTLLIFLLVLAACSTTTHRTTTHPQTTPTEHERVVDIQHMDQGPSFDEESNSPALTLVSEGIQKFKDDLVEEAEWKFEEAINLDPDYGPAYYWLARIKYRQDNLNQCREFLKKAERLLKNSDVWMERVEGFKEFLMSEPF